METEEKTELKPNEYICDYCKGVFEFGWSEEEAEEELKKNFGDIQKDECVLVCDDCYKELMR